MPDIITLGRILKENHTIAVVGLSAKWYRPSFFAAKYLQEHGYRIIPVNPNYDEILGETCYPSLADIPGDINVDVVDLFQRAELAPAYVDQARAINARVVWLQLGLVSEEAADKARQAGMEIVMDRCMKIEHARLFGGINFVGVNRGLISARRPRYVPY